MRSRKIIFGGVTILIHKGTQELHTERLKLRKFILSDARFMYKNYATDQRVTQFLTWKPYKNIDDIKAFLSAKIDDYRFQNVYHWAIEINDEIIGSISTISIDEKNHSCEIGYCIGCNFWNKGITSEALLAVMDFLFNEVNMHRIIAKHDIQNPASGKVMLKCNMTQEGRLREHYKRHDETYSDSLVYGILRNEFVRNK